MSTPLAVALEESKALLCPFAIGEQETPAQPGTDSRARATEPVLVIVSAVAVRSVCQLQDGFNLYGDVAR